MVDIVISEKNRLQIYKKTRPAQIRIKHTCKRSFTGSTLSTLSKPDSSPETQIPAKNNIGRKMSLDPRLNSERFRQVVRCVFEYLGIENTRANFRTWNSLLDWNQIARSIDRPKMKTAMYYLLDRQGLIVENIGVKVISAHDITACTDAEAVEILRKECKQFIRWF